MDEKKYYVALTTHQKIGARTIGKLYKRFKKISAVWSAKEVDLAAAGLDLGQINAVKEVISKVDPDRALQEAEKRGISVVTLADKEYPALLKEIPDLPAVLYIKGKLLPEDEVSLAVVGSRKYTTYGQRLTEDLVYKLAKNKLTIVSGLALGIDALAHQAALEAKGRTIGVLGCGLDQIYPVSNTRLADKILQSGGAIISEFPIGMPAYRSNFPMRNRIIAGMSLGTLVIEAAVDSGSLITAKAALEYNREVYAVPGHIYSETSEGPNKLLKMGAKLVTEADDILTDLQIAEKSGQKEAQEILADTPEEEILLNLLKKPNLVDEIIRTSKLPAPLVNSTLIMLEMKGMISNLGGTCYVIKGKLKKK
ncbi:MAG: protecting protein DprA, DNA processing protein [Berkelbacteria bacterium GW2011_GWE1_39_12]|uniref:Protecting protein DprA, DNA processing protein n=1 Tax=Berkelbacteria bacterium GW2011_GWE1_39_12 TaxID=1618337 RepID=A0A0G4B2S5_9BACT|nr:MAG: protecting protein DprA, DNA processing protein [Berkelbacteria bacterium GW2011_GWE1_39_12]